MRMKPIEKPRSWKMKLAYWLCARRYGRVITPFKVVQARIPASIPIYQRFSDYMKRDCRLDPALSLLIQAWTANYNKCAFCIDITCSFAAHEPELLEKLWRARHYKVDPVFTEAERAALAYVEEVTRDRAPRDATYAELRRHFSNNEIVEITLVNAIENFYNLVNRPLGIESDGLCAVRPPGRAAAAPKEPVAP